jgi:hypothetical protein
MHGFDSSGFTHKLKTDRPLESKEILVEALLEAAVQSEATATTADQYGERYVIDFPLTTTAGTSMVPSAWIILQGENSPRLTSVYPI